MSETIKGLPEFDAQYKNRMDRESMHDLTKRNTVEQWERIACRERQLLAAIARAELAEAKLEDEAWISVGDRLPLVVDHLLEYKGGNERHFCVGYWNRIVRCWIVNAESYPGLDVTHWRPLPSPPEEHAKEQQ